ncbi:MAG: hypothetical protein AAGF31_08420 [Planctomycetota bacterium]
MTTHFRIFPLALLVVTLAIAGCEPADSTTDVDGHEHGHEHDHHHGSRPDSLHAAVHQLTEILDEIRAAIVEGDAEDAHEPLHEAEELLAVLPDVAAETDLPEVEWTAVKMATERLKESVAVIDEAFHAEGGDEKSAYEQVAESLEVALTAIRSRLPLTGEDPAEAHHEEHDHHDDHDHHNGDEDHDEDDHTDDDHDSATTSEGETP